MIDFAGLELEAQLAVAKPDHQRPAVIAVRIVEEDSAAQIAADDRIAKVDEGRVGVCAIIHAGLIFGQQRRSDLVGEGEFPEFLAARKGLQHDLRAGLAGGRIVQLLVVLGLVVRIGRPTVDERGVWPQSAGIRQLRQGSSNGSMRYIQNSRSARSIARASSRRRFRRAGQRANGRRDVGTMPPFRVGQELGP